MEKRQAELLACEYFHVVFTLPAELAALALQNKRQIYDLLFRATADTLQSIPADPKHLGAQIGFFFILHSWRQTLNFHPHLHCVVPGGGISLDGSHWVSCRPGFFLPVKVLSRRFRKLFLRYLEQTYAAGRLQFYGDLQELSDPESFASYLAPLHDREWVVYAKTPFGGPDRVLNYLGRYTHRVAISNNRLQTLHNGQVAFAYKDYKHPQRPKLATLTADEFLRRFLLHVLPDCFQRIRSTAFSATGTAREIWSAAGNCSPCPCQSHHRNGITENGRNNSPDTTRCDALIVIAARWCESRASP